MQRNPQSRVEISVPTSSLCSSPPDSIPPEILPCLMHPKLLYLSRHTTRKIYFPCNLVSISNELFLFALSFNIRLFVSSSLFSSSRFCCNLFWNLLFYYFNFETIVKIHTAGTNLFQPACCSAVLLALPYSHSLARACIEQIHSLLQAN